MRDCIKGKDEELSKLQLWHLVKLLTPDCNYHRFDG
ncbi:hypothetical protein BVRB_3g053970 isoform B [Beta vulgaris subsp. vulgaris]|nr:hypothetical protein BVRB_3g053970 isoform B [Beta vulgaris subsp. vulgaris]